MKILSLTFTVLALNFLTLTSNAQTSDDLVGKWVFKEALNEGIDEGGMETLQQEIINKMTFDFSKNGNFVAFAFGEPMNGKWSLSKDPLRISLLTEDQDNIEFLILELKADRLVLNLGLGKFLMVKKEG